MIDIKAYQPGTICTISGIKDESGDQHKTWAILSTTIELVESDNLLRSHEMTQFLTILAVDGNGNDLGSSPIRINSDMYDIVEV